MQYSSQERFDNFCISISPGVNNTYGKHEKMSLVASDNNFGANYLSRQNTLLQELVLVWDNFRKAVRFLKNNVQQILGAL